MSDLEQQPDESTSRWRAWRKVGGQLPGEFRGGDDVVIKGRSKPDPSSIRKSLMLELALFLSELPSTRPKHPSQGGRGGRGRTKKKKKRRGPARWPLVTLRFFFFIFPSRRGRHPPISLHTHTSASQRCVCEVRAVSRRVADHERKTHARRIADPIAPARAPAHTNAPNNACCGAL